MRVIGSQDYIRSDTGEIVTMEVKEYLEERDFNFTKVWLKDFARIIENLTSPSQNKFLMWIITHVNRDNQVPMTVKQMAEAAGISRLTATITMKTLKAANFVKKVGTAYMVNPDIIFKGSTKLRIEARRKYNIND